MWGKIKHLHILSNCIGKASTPKDQRCCSGRHSPQTPVRNSDTLTEGDSSPPTHQPPPKIWQLGGHTVTGARISLAVYFPYTNWVGGLTLYLIISIHPEKICWAHRLFYCLLHIFMHTHTCYVDDCYGENITYSWTFTVSLSCSYNFW